jgi:hypothetical protein
VHPPPNKQHLALLKRGVEAWNRWREDNREAGRTVDADLSDVDLSGEMLGGIELRFANLYGTKLCYANLRGADLERAYLIDADLTTADLVGANFKRAKLYRADLRLARLNGANLAEAELVEAELRNADLANANLDGVNLTGSSLVGANLHFTVLSRAQLNGVDFENATISYSTFVDCDLSEAKGLDLVRHDGPSSIGLDTIYKSQGKIPDSFLRGCGVPESFITEMKSLVGAIEGIQFYSCFISYSSKDEEFARRLHGRMRDAHLRVWFAPEDIQGGKKLHEQIETAIRVYDKLLIVLSASSLRSEWVMTELRKARKAERRSGKRKLFPVRLVDFETLRNWECFDADSGKDLAVELREYFIPDFSNWKNHDSFEAAAGRLIKDLSANSVGT